MAADTGLPQVGIAKCPTGISGLDEITSGGLPQGRPTLVCGSAGCGKTLLAIEFLVRGATRFGEPGVFMAFEETREELTQNVRSLGFDLEELQAEGKLALDHVRVERAEIEETGEYDLEGLFIRLNYAIESVGAKRVVLDTIESLFSGLANPAILRAELRRLFRWLKDKGVTAVITGERGDGALTRHGLEEYVSDCVILLDHRVAGQVSTRRLRVVKYRGSLHGTNEYPFLIDEDGITVLPVTSLALTHPVTDERISTGIARLDEMLGGEGLYRGTSVLISGTAGTGKSSLAAHCAQAACRRGETCLYFAFEESRDQIIRNMRSIGIDLQSCVDQGRLVFVNARPSLYGLEMHLAVMHKLIAEHNPHIVVVDPASNFMSVGAPEEVGAMLVRLVDFLKARQVTALFTNLTSGNMAQEATETGISSIMDTWLMLRDIEVGGERNRGIYVLKSRGTAHSNQIREFILTAAGVELVDVYTGPAGVLTGSARRAQEARESAQEEARRQQSERERLELDKRRAALRAQMAALEAEMHVLEAEAGAAQRRERERVERESEDRAAMGRIRGAAGDGNAPGDSR